MAEEEGVKWYFGYGSNMSTAQLIAGKGVVPSESVPAKLEGWKLKFNLRPIFKTMGSMANIVKCPGSVVHGMLHKLTDAQMKDVDQFEGEGHVYHRIPVAVHTYDGRTIQAGTYEVPPESKWVGMDGAPDLRYKTILLNGARSHGLDQNYVAFLEAVEHAPFAYDKDRDKPLIPEKKYTREEVQQDPMLLSYMGFVFDVSSTDPYMRQVLTSRGPPEFLLIRMMPHNSQDERPKVPEDFREFSSEQVAFLDTWLQAMELEWPIMGTCPPPTLRSCI